jgi:hypothetical protein
MLLEQDDEWHVGRRYFSEASMAELRPKPPPSIEDQHAAR